VGGVPGGDGCWSGSVRRRCSGRWIVDITLTDDGIEGFNEIAARCYRQDATCPLGQLALVVDDRIVFAPTIQAPSFQRDEIQVSGDFTEGEARSVADALAR
jgi:preprotein translocase subunit SecD